MSGERRIVAAKLFSIGGFLVLLLVTYWLRSEVLGLSRIRFSADEKRVELEQQRNKESFPERQKQHEIALKNYDLQLKHYEKVLAIYERDLDEYANLTKSDLKPPRLPDPPEKPNSPEIEDQFRQIQAEFVTRRYRYFAVSEYGNGVACLAALSLVGGLLYLLMFDTNGNRLYYFMLLMLSFVFLIGPSLQSLMTGIISLMSGPLGM
ncbi:hypothetical protein [Schlesneria sp.]|uniref:hypothetical protein n=1 Tax=Schlesneria sp. TaxID=2762018 RepID=UPI002F19C0F0